MKESPEFINVSAPTENVVEKVEAEPGNLESALETAEARLENIDEEILKFSENARESATSTFELKEKALALYKNTKEKILNLIFPEIPPPIKEGEEFLPEGKLRDILKTPSGERKAQLKEFKEKYAYQKEGLAFIQEDMIARIRQYPDMHLDNYRYLKEIMSSRYGFSPAQKEIALSVFNEYARKHNEVAAIRREYPDDTKLFIEVFGEAPKGQVEVIEGPMTLYFRCYNPEDYTFIHSQAYLDRKHPDAKDFRSAMMSQGLSVATSLRNGLEGTIIAENTYSIIQNTDRIVWVDDKGMPIKDEKIIEQERGEYVEKRSREVLVHEEQHAIKRLFEENSGRQMLYQEIIAAKTNSEVIEIAGRYLRRIRRQDIEPLAKDEILAYFKENVNAPNIYRALTKSREEGGLYDYWGKRLERGDIPKIFKSIFTVEGIKRLFNPVFKNEYHALIENSIRNVYFLEEKGYSKEQVIALLINEPLSKWAKVVGRLVAGKFFTDTE